MIKTCTGRAFHSEPGSKPRTRKAARRKAATYGLVWLRRRRARWRPFYRATRASGVQVGLERAGSRAIGIANLDPHADDFSDRLAAARAGAVEKAAALNAAGRG